MSNRRVLVLVVACLLFSSGCAAILDGSPPAQLEPVAICTFNIKFLGHYKTIDRDDEGLARVLEEFDIIVIQELVAPPTDVIYPNGDWQTVTRKEINTLRRDIPVKPTSVVISPGMQEIDMPRSDKIFDHRCRD